MRTRLWTTTRCRRAPSPAPGNRRIGDRGEAPAGLRWRGGRRRATRRAAAQLPPFGLKARGIGSAGLDRRAGPPVCQLGARAALVFGHPSPATGQFGSKQPRPSFRTTRGNWPIQSQTASADFLNHTASGGVGLERRAGPPVCQLGAATGARQMANSVPNCLGRLSEPHGFRNHTTGPSERESYVESGIPTDGLSVSSPRQAIIPIPPKTASRAPLDRSHAPMQPHGCSLTIATNIPVAHIATVAINARRYFRRHIKATSEHSKHITAQCSHCGKSDPGLHPAIIFVIAAKPTSPAIRRAAIAAITFAFMRLSHPSGGRYQFGQHHLARALREYHSIQDIHQY